MKVIYTDWLIPKRFAGYTVGLLIFIRPRYRDDRGLLEHEKVHVRQFKEDWLFDIKYLLDKDYRLSVEIEAYKEQLKWYNDDRTEIFARFLVNNYKLSITFELAVNLLKSP